MAVRLRFNVLSNLLPAAMRLIPVAASILWILTTTPPLWGQACISEEARTAGLALAAGGGVLREVNSITSFLQFEGSYRRSSEGADSGIAGSVMGSVRLPADSPTAENPYRFDVGYVGVPLRLPIIARRLQVCPAFRAGYEFSTGGYERVALLQTAGILTLRSEEREDVPAREYFVITGAISERVMFPEGYDESDRTRVQPFIDVGMIQALGRWSLVVRSEDLFRGGRQAKLRIQVGFRP